LAVRRKLSMLATMVFFSAVVQNSKKWKMDKAVRKKGSRQPGLSVRNRVTAVEMTPMARAMPRQKALKAMPDKDFG
jgi:hypothetical protein